jgi:hypothetical protein
MLVGGDDEFSFEITIFDEKRLIRLVEHHTLFVLAAVFVPKVGSFPLLLLSERHFPHWSVISTLFGDGCTITLGIYASSIHGYECRPNSRQISPSRKVNPLLIHQFQWLDLRSFLISAARKWKKGDPYKGKKNFIAGLRFVLFALQLVERECIFDFQVWAKRNKIEIIMISNRRFGCL